MFRSYFLLRLTIVAFPGRPNKAGHELNPVSPSGTRSQILRGAPECQRVRIGIAACLIKTGFESSNLSAGARFLVVEIVQGERLQPAQHGFSSPTRSALAHGCIR